MSDDTPSTNSLSEAERRQRRQAEALRVNLARRKAQARERAEDASPTAKAAPDKEPPAEG